MESEPSDVGAPGDPRREEKQHHDGGPGGGATLVGKEGGALECTLMWK